MKRSTLVLAAGIFLTVSMTYLWGLSGRWRVSAYFLPEGASTRKEDFRGAFSVHAGMGYLSFHHYRINAAPRRVFWKNFGADLESLSEIHAATGGRYPLPKWSDVAKGRFAWGTSDKIPPGINATRSTRPLTAGRRIAVPFWVVVVLLLAGTAAGWRILRRRERKMIAEGRLS